MSVLVKSIVNIIATTVADTTYESAFENLHLHDHKYNSISCNPCITTSITETEISQPNSESEIKLRQFDLPLDTLRFLPISMAVPKRLNKK
jgi:hypothetical protein